MSITIETPLANETTTVPWNGKVPPPWNDTAPTLPSSPQEDVLGSVIAIMGLMIIACCIVCAIINAARSEHESVEEDFDAQRRRAYFANAAATATTSFQERLEERVKQCIVVRYWTTVEASTTTTSKSPDHKGDHNVDENTVATDDDDHDHDTADVDLEKQEEAGREESASTNTTTTTTTPSSRDPTHAEDDLESINDGTLCAICLNQFQDHDVVCDSKNPACCHVFHLTCMSLWLRKHSSCPVCREEYLHGGTNNNNNNNNNNTDTARYHHTLAIWEASSSFGLHT
jgi:Ring finger domain